MRFLLVLAVAITMTGCSDEDGDPANWVAVGDMPGAYKAAYCTYLARCGLFPDQATCVAAALNVVPTLDPNVVAAVGAGRILYNGSNVKSCFDAVANDTCDSTDANGRAHVPACGVYFRGTVFGGGDCFVDQECISQQCDGGDTGTTCTRGTCVGDMAPDPQVVAIGDFCTSSTQCIDGAYCSIDTNTCTALKTSGQPCSGIDECGYGLGCAGTTGERTCQPLPGLSETCRFDLPCRDEGHVCIASVCTQVGVAGSPCTSSVQCSPFYRCDTTAGVCAKAPSIGDTCSAGSRCFDAGTYCDTESLTCVAAKADGMPCTSDAQCANEHCDFGSATPVCASPPLCF